MTGAQVVPETLSVLQQLEKDLLRWARQAVRAGIGKWQRSRRPPGMAARFTTAAPGYYGWPAYRRSAVNGRQPYVRSGATRRAMLRKRVVTKADRTAGTVGGRISMVGGAIALMKRRRAITRLTRQVSVEPVTHQETIVSGYRRAGGVNVSAYIRPAYTSYRRIVTYDKTYDTRTLFARFVDTGKDEPAIQKQIYSHMIGILKTAKTRRISKRKLQLVSDYLEQLGHG